MSTLTAQLDEKTYGQLLRRTLPHVIHTDEECERLTNELLRGKTQRVLRSFADVSESSLAVEHDN